MRHILAIRGIGKTNTTLNFLIDKIRQEGGEVEIYFRMELTEEQIKDRLDFTAFEPIPKYGDLFTVDAIDLAVDQGAITSDDGHGYWATSTKMSRLDYFSVQRPSWATHVIWFNK